MTKAEAIQKYGEISAGMWPQQSTWMVSALIPDKWAKNWINTATGYPVQHIYMNKDLQGPLFKAFQNMEDGGLINELRTFDGCFAIRNIRGSLSEPSMHSWGLATDWNSSTNVLGVAGDMSPAVVKCFEDAGFNWGGHFTRCDMMHFELK